MIYEAVSGGSLQSLVFCLQTDSVIIFIQLSPVVTQVNRSQISDDVGISKSLQVGMFVLK